ncbi:hypothetical protein C8Q79DRAFT_571098 [Trametes meyenii]|nr:hypothetical protein C8Q79DRAFT_571098 [Trametes meyenii]
MSTTATHPEAFVLLHISDVILAAAGATERGTLALECVTLAPNDDKATQLAASLSHEDRSLYLVLHLNALELPLDPTHPISVQVGRDGARTYTFQSIESPVDQASSTIYLTVPIPARPDAHRAETVEAFDHILAQYAEVSGLSLDPATRSPNSNAQSPTAGQPDQDLRGRLVLVDEESGEVVGELPNRVHISEDPALAKAEKGKDGEPAPVLLELPPDVYDAYTGQGTSVVPYHEPESDLDEAKEIFVRAIPPEDQDWITKSATFVSQAITSSTTMLLSGLSSAASYYIHHSTPSPHATSLPQGTASQTSKDGSTPPPPPPRALLLLSHPRTHATLSRAYAVSGQAVKVSQKTIGVVESMIRRAVGGRDKPNAPTLARPQPPLRATSVASAPVPPVSAALSSSSSASPPPPYPGYSTSLDSGKPPLPPRRGPAPPLPPRSRSKSPLPGEDPPSVSQFQPPVPGAAPAGEGKPLKAHHKLLLSANLILATVDDSAKRVFDGASTNLTAVMGHKYGADAGKSTHLATHTARNVTLVYIDMQGLARRALIRKAGKEWIKARVGGRHQASPQMSGIVVDKQA